MKRTIARRRLAWPSVAIACCLFWSASPARAADDKPHVTLKKVVLYSSGVGFFEHAGQVDGNEKVELKFNVDGINDLLKSMVLQDEGGGHINTITYGSKDPATKTLKTFAIDLTREPTLAQLLRQIRGEKVQVSAPNEITGTIIGIERRKQKLNKDESIEVDVLNLRTPTGLRSVPLESVFEVRLLDEKLDAELQQALDILASRHATDKKSVVLDFRGQGKRSVRVGYIQEAPVWKTSYRLVVEDDGSPFLQGWAIVENTTEHDWNEVSLTLVSGRPISFIMDLYQPLYATRPVVVPDMFASLRPRAYDQDLAGKEAAFRKLADGQPDESGPKGNRQRGSSAGFGGGAFGGGFGGPGPTPNERPFVISVIPVAPGSSPANEQPIDLKQGVRSAAQAEDVGELFRYNIAAPVTLAREQSAMLPIVNDPIKGEKVAIYNSAVHPKHPLNGLAITNSTDLHLMQGPVTIFDGGAYAGDARIEDLAPGAERLISYALDLDTEVAPDSKEQPAQLVQVKITKGVLVASRKSVREHHYIVKNSGGKAKKVLIEYPRDASWKLVAPAAPVQKTRDTYRFAVTAEPGKPATLDVEEQQVTTERLAVARFDAAQVADYAASGAVSPEVKKALADAIERKQSLADAAAQREQLNARVNEIAGEQSRIRQNMERLDQKSDLYKRYVTKLTEQEDETETLGKQLREVKLDEARKQKALDDFLQGLDLS